MIKIKDHVRDTFDLLPPKWNSPLMGGHVCNPSILHWYQVFLLPYSTQSPKFGSIWHKMTFKGAWSDCFRFFFKPSEILVSEERSYFSHLLLVTFTAENDFKEAQSNYLRLFSNLLRFWHQKKGHIFLIYSWWLLQLKMTLKKLSPITSDCFQTFWDFGISRKVIFFSFTPGDFYSWKMTLKKLSTIASDCFQTFWDFGIRRKVIFFSLVLGNITAGKRYPLKD